MEKIKGLITAPFTPMLQDGTVNLDMIQSLYEVYRKNNVVGVFVNGSTGEGLSLTTGERKRIAEVWSEVVDDDFKLIIHVGHSSIYEAKEITRHASSLNISGVATVGPFYSKPSSLDQLVEFCAEISQCSPELPFYYYHIPALTGVHFSMADFLLKASQRIPNLQGVKYTDTNLVDFYRCRQVQDGRFDLLYGNDELLICGLSLGAQGFVGSTYNYMPHLYYEIMDAFQHGDVQRARELQGLSMEVIRIIGSYEYNGAAKQVMKLLGLDLGPVRLPLKNLTGDEIRELKARLKETDFFDYTINVEGVKQ